MAHSKAAAENVVIKPVARTPVGIVSDAPDRKLAEVIAEKIENDVIARGWPVGEVLGSEAELLKQYGVSRSVLREAIRLLEHHQVARMRPGPGSGLVITAPDSAAVAKALSLYLEFQKVNVAQLLEAKRAVELTCVQLAAQRISADGVERLRDALEKERNTPLEEARNITGDNLHILLAELTGNPALHVVANALTKLTITHAVDVEPEGAERTYEAHAHIAEAVISGDGALAAHAMRCHLDDLETNLD